MRGLLKGMIMQTPKVTQKQLNKLAFEYFLDQVMGGDFECTFAEIYYDNVSNDKVNEMMQKAMDKVAEQLRKHIR